MYWVSVVTEAGIFAILALGLDLVWGWGGDFDLAFYGYLALGSYMTFVFSIGRPTNSSTEYIIGWHLPVVVSILLAVVIVVGLAAIIGAVALRNLREIYFAITTLAAVTALYLLVGNYTPLFDGFNGVYGLINPGQTALNLTYNGYRIVFGVVVLVVLLLAYLLVQRLSGSPFGRMLRAVREDERAAAAYGRKVFTAKYRAYLFGAAFAGLAGGLFAIFISAFNPSAEVRSADGGKAGPGFRLSRDNVRLMPRRTRGAGAGMNSCRSAIAIIPRYSSVPNACGEK